MKACLLLFFYFLAQLVYGQAYYFRQIAVPFEEDFQQISILYQAKDQMVWLGTEKGIYSFDGQRYRFFDRPDHHAQKVTAISESPDGKLWIGYEDGYLHALSFQGFNQVIPTDSIVGSAISKILFGQKDEVFITTYGKGVWRLHDKQLTKIRFQSLADIDDVYDALLDAWGRLWMATDNGIWIYHNELSETLVHLDQGRGLPDEIVTQLEMADHGDIWIGLYDYGLARFVVDEDSAFSQIQMHPSAGNVIGLEIGNLSDVWLGTDKTVDHYSQDGTIRHVHLPVELGNRLECILFDKAGNLWLASGNKLFIANTEIEFFSPRISGIQAIAVANRSIWLGCEQGLFRMDMESHQLEPYLSNQKINILSLYTDPSGVLWIGTFGQGLYVFNPEGNRFRHLTEKQKISNNSILNIDGRDNKVWLATLGGISEIRWNSDPLLEVLEIIEFQDKYNFPAGYVYDVYVAENGLVWFGTDGKGLYCLQNEKLDPVAIHFNTSMQEEDQVKTIYSITDDARQNLWISGSNGKILHLDAEGHLVDQIATPPGSLNSLITGLHGEILMIREGAIQIRNQFGITYTYNESAGISAFTPNINAVARTKYGSLWIADSDQIIHYSPVELDTNRRVQVLLEEISPGSLLSDFPVTIKSDSNFLDISYTGLWYQNPADVRYRYMLEGHDQDWIYTQERRAVYSKLSPGNYTFKVAGSHNDDFSVAKPLLLEIIVLPPVYLRWWFITGISLLVAWGIFAYIRARIKRINALHQLEKEKTMLQLHAIQAQVNPHFLFNSFNTLASIIEEDQHAAVTYVDQFSGFFRGVLMHRNAELIRMEEEMDIVRNYTYILQKRYGENLRIIEHIENLTGWIAPLSIQLLVENAIKHNIVSADKPLTITISIDDHWVKVSNPKQAKMQASTESTGFGLSSLVARYHYITDKPVEILGEANTFTVKIPVIYAEKPV